MKTIGERIRAARQSRGFTQADLGQSVGKSQTIISNYEAGNRVMPITDILIFAEVLDKPVSYFFGGIDPEWELTELYNNLAPANKQVVLNLLRSLSEQQSQVS